MTADPFPGDFPGTISAPPDVARLRERSDLVCLGEVVDVAEAGEVRYLVGSEEYTFERVVSTVRVDETLQGSSDGETIEVEWLRFDIPSALARLERGDRAVLFLTRTDDRYRLADVGSGRQDASDELRSKLA